MSKWVVKIGDDVITCEDGKLSGPPERVKMFVNEASNPLYRYPTSLYNLPGRHLVGVGSREGFYLLTFFIQQKTDEPWELIEGFDGMWPDWGEIDPDLTY